MESLENVNQFGVYINQHSLQRKNNSLQAYIYSSQMAISTIILNYMYVFTQIGAIDVMNLQRLQILMNSELISTY